MLEMGEDDFVHGFSFTTGRCSAVATKRLHSVVFDECFYDCCAPQMFRREGLTVCVTRWWAGRGNATLTELTSSRENCLKTRRLPPVGCTLCWAIFCQYGASIGGYQFSWLVDVCHTQATLQRVKIDHARHTLRNCDEPGYHKPVLAALQSAFQQRSV